MEATAQEGCAPHGNIHCSTCEAHEAFKRQRARGDRFRALLWSIKMRLVGHDDLVSEIDAALRIDE